MSFIAVDTDVASVTSNLHPSGFDTIMPKTLATATVDRPNSGRRRLRVSFSTVGRTSPESPGWKIGSTRRRVISGNAGADQAGALARELPGLTAGHLGVWHVCGTTRVAADVMASTGTPGSGPRNSLASKNPLISFFKR